MNEAALFPFTCIDLILISVSYLHAKMDQIAFFNGMKTELDHGSNQLKGLGIDIILGCKIF